MLKTLVKVSGIENLSDARYCAGMGVEFLGFPLAQIPFEKFQEILWNSNYQWHNTLTSILSVQWLCETKKWPYRFTTFREGLGEYIKHCSPQFLSLQQEINWDKFVFTDNNYGGLREFTLSTINTWDDGYDNHPSHDAHKLFVNDFWLKQFPNIYQ